MNAPLSPRPLAAIWLVMSTAALTACDDGSDTDVADASVAAASDVGSAAFDAARDDGSADSGVPDATRAAPDAAPQLVGLDLTAFDAEVDAILAELELEGATVVVVHADAGIVHHRGYGAFEANRISFIASSSKVLTAGVLMRLHDEGVVDVDAPISTYLADWGPREHDPTIAQLLSNSSGMLGLLDNPAYAPYICQYLVAGTLLECGRTLSTADDAAVTVPPDTAFRYGGAQWQLAGALAVHVTGQSWDALLEDTYRTPCELDVLGYSNPFQMSILNGGIDAATRYPEFFAGDPADLPTTDNPNMEGGGYTTVLDYGRLLLMHLRGGVCPGGRVLSPESVERMQRDRIAEWGGEIEVQGYDAYGLGWWSRHSEPGVVLDPGSFGAVPWLDVNRRYGAMVMLESRVRNGLRAQRRLRPLLDAAMDAATLAD